MRARKKKGVFPPLEKKKKVERVYPIFPGMKNDILFRFAMLVLQFEAVNEDPHLWQYFYETDRNECPIDMIIRAWKMQFREAPYGYFFYYNREWYYLGNLKNVSCQIKEMEARLQGKLWCRFLESYD